MKLTWVSLTVHLLISSIRTFNWKILPRLLAVIIVQHKIWFCTIIVQVEIPSFTHMIVNSSIDLVRNRLVYTSYDQLWINSWSCNCDIQSSFQFFKLTIIVRIKNRDRTLVWSKKIFIRISFDREHYIQDRTEQWYDRPCYLEWWVIRSESLKWKSSV